MTQALREKVARAIQAADDTRIYDGYADGMHGDISDWGALLADAAILVCREHFAGVANRYMGPDRYNDLPRMIAEDIRSEGEK